MQTPFYKESSAVTISLFLSRSIYVGQRYTALQGKKKCLYCPSLGLPAVIGYRGCSRPPPPLTHTHTPPSRPLFKTPFLKLSPSLFHVNEPLTGQPPLSSL